MKMKFKYHSKILSYFLILSIWGCDAPQTTNLAPENKHHEITIKTEQNINGKFAISVDFVQVYEQKTFDVIKSMDAKTFFERKNQILLDNPENLSIWTFDFISNQTNYYRFPNHKNYWGIIVFLHFFDGDGQRIILPLNRYHTRLRITDGTFTISTDNKGNRHFKQLDQGGNL